MEQEIHRLRLALGRLERGRGKRYSAELKQRVAAAAIELRRKGQGWQSIGRLLGIPHETVRRFADGAGRAAFVPVVVAEPKSSGLTLVTPEGVRVEGLSVAEVAEILRRLR